MVLPVLMYGLECWTLREKTTGGRNGMVVTPRAFHSKLGSEVEAEERRKKQRKTKEEMVSLF